MHENQGIARMDKVFFEVLPGEGVEGETVWATRVNDSFFRIENVPLFAHGVAMGDVVACESRSGENVAVGVVAESGCVTIRFTPILNSQRRCMALVRQIGAEFEGLGGSCEIDDIVPMVSVCVPRSSDVVAARTLLEDLMKRHEEVEIDFLKYLDWWGMSNLEFDVSPDVTGGAWA